MEHVAKAYYLEEASRRPAVLHAKQVEAAVNECDSGGHMGAFPVDPLMVSSGVQAAGCAGWDAKGRASAEAHARAGRLAKALSSHVRFSYVAAPLPPALPCAGAAVPNPRQVPQHQGAVRLGAICTRALQDRAARPATAWLQSCTAGKPAVPVLLGFDQHVHLMRRCNAHAPLPTSLPQVFTNVSGDTAANNLAVLACGIALAAHSLAASGAELPISGASSSSSTAGAQEGGSGGSGDGDHAGGSSGSEAGDGPEARRQLQQQLAEFLRFLADT